MERHAIRLLPTGPLVHVDFTDRTDGDLQIDLPVADLTARRSAITPSPWTWLRQVHGASVVTVTAPGEHAGAEADAAVTASPGAALAIHTADCAPIALIGQGVVGAAHAGWRGLVDGVIGATAAAMSELGGPPEVALVGPCIHAAHYEFGEAELELLVERFGPEVRGSTEGGAPALDVPAAVGVALREIGVDDVRVSSVDTATSSSHFSHRTRGDRGRQAMVVWMT